MTDQDRDQVLPPGFAAQLSRLIAPGDADAAGRALREAADFDDARLAAFLERLAARIRRSSDLLTAAELSRLLAEA